MDEALNIIRNKAEKVVWDKRDGSQRTLDKSDLCPISGKWLIPASCTEIEPPKVEEGYKVFFENNEWQQERTKEQIEKEETQKHEPVVKSLREQIEELQSQIEQLKFEKEEIKLDIKNIRAEALELSTNLILQKKSKEGEVDGLESGLGDSDN